MHILITNDDGVTAPGLFALVQEMRSLGKVTVLAPDHNWSTSGHVKTLSRPLRIKEVRLSDGSPAFATDGAPADCVAMAVMGFIEEKVDLVISGINPDANLAQDLTYSGTVTAAIEAAIWGVAGIAVSLDLPVGLAKPDFDTAARLARQVISQVMAHNPLPELLLNINIPYLPAEQIKGVMITRQGKRIYRDELVKRIDPMGRPYYWIGGEPPTGLPEEGTDIGALAAGYISITPLHLSMTAYQALDKLKQWDWKLDLT